MRTIIRVSVQCPQCHYTPAAYEYAVDKNPLMLPLTALRMWTLCRCGRASYVLSLKAV